MVLSVWLVVQWWSSRRMRQTHFLVALCLQRSLALPKSCTHHPSGCCTTRPTCIVCMSPAVNVFSGFSVTVCGNWQKSTMYLCSSRSKTDSLRRRPSYTPDTSVHIRTAYLIGLVLDSSLSLLRLDVGCSEVTLGRLRDTCIGNRIFRPPATPGHMADAALPDSRSVSTSPFALSAMCTVSQSCTAAAALARSCRSIALSAACGQPGAFLRYSGYELNDIEEMLAHSSVGSARAATVCPSASPHRPACHGLMRMR